MNSGKFIIAVFLTSMLFSCQNEEIKLSENDYIVFGDFYGECYGSNCIDIYRLESKRLLVDTKKQYPNSTDFYAGEFIETDSARYNAVKDLTKYFPGELLSINEEIIGSPDAGDWGGFYVEYNYNGTHKHWLIDKMKNNVPTALHSFIDLLNQKLAYLESTKK